MKFRICLSLLVALLAGTLCMAQSVSDVEQAVRDIQRGEDNINRIEHLLVGTSAELPMGSLDLADIGDSLTYYHSTNTTTATSGFTAAKAGVLLFGYEGGSQRVWRASAATSTNWVKILVLP